MPISKKIISGLPFLLLGLGVLVLMVELSYYLYARKGRDVKEVPVVSTENPLDLKVAENGFDVPESLRQKKVQAKLTEVAGNKLTFEVVEGGQSVVVSSGFDVYLMQPTDGSMPKDERLTLKDLVNQDLQVSMSFDNDIRSVMIYY